MLLCLLLQNKQGVSSENIDLQDLAKELLGTFTARKMAKVFFTNSGSEANDTQVFLQTGIHISNEYNLVIDIN